jgi:ATP-dependent DNA helicase PIF1
VHPDLYNVQDQSAILSAWNDEVDKINDECLKKMNSLTEYTLRSNDELANEPGQVMYPTEFLNSLTPSGFPLFNLRLKIGSPVMLLRNMNPSKGLCNGTRIKITHVSKNLIKGIVLNGTNIGSEALLPRILFTTDDTSPFQFTRRQFPVKLAYAMTVNKCQGQSMCRIGIYLPRPLFNHGGLYVALSRCTTPENVRVLVTSLPNVQGEFINTVGIHTRNIVYSEVFK